jgi:hypothetical protein
MDNQVNRQGVQGYEQAVLEQVTLRPFCARNVKTRCSMKLKTRLVRVRWGREP